MAFKKKQVAKKTCSEAKVEAAKKKRKTCEGTKEALLRLQKLRVGGTWAMCSLPACSKWRYLAHVLDPAEVGDHFTCRDCPDRRYNTCQAPEQNWDSALDCHSVETRFTVGSLVWAKMNGFPAWPAMVDDDPNTGEFFWTDQLGDPLQIRPTHYHVIFFDKEVTRKWIACSRLTKFDHVRPEIPETVLGCRLQKAFERAAQAAREQLEDRREKHCFAQLYKGAWGPVWEECGSERMDLHIQDGDISPDLLSLGDTNMSFNDGSFSCDLLNVANSTAAKSQPFEEGTPCGDNMDLKPVAKKSEPVKEKSKSPEEEVQSGVNMDPKPAAKKSKPVKEGVQDDVNVGPKPFATKPVEENVQVVVNMDQEPVAKKSKPVPVKDRKIKNLKKAKENLSPEVQDDKENSLTKEISEVVMQSHLFQPPAKEQRNSWSDM